MSFIPDITTLQTLSIVGLAKNTGKTETLNYILRKLRDFPSLTLGLTSIGIDGEKRDQVTMTDKPEIKLREGVFFVTAEKFYKEKRLPAEVCGVDQKIRTPLGLTIYAKSRGEGKVLIAGPSTTLGLKIIIEQLQRYGVNLCIIDGALSRMSLASPSVAQGIVLATGAAYSSQPERLVQATKFIVQLIKIPAINQADIANQLADVGRSIYIIDKNGELFDTEVESALLDSTWEYLAKKIDAEKIFIPGVVTDNILERLKTKKIKTLLVKDFTRIYASPQIVASFLKTGHRLEVLHSTRLVGITFNPQSPNGYKMNSDKMCAMLSEVTNMPVIDVRKNS